MTTATDPRWQELVDRAVLLRRAHQPDQANELLIQARELAEQAGDHEHAVRAELKRSRLAEELGDPSLPEEAARYALERLAPDDPPAYEALAQALLAASCQERGDGHGTLDALAKARALIELEFDPSAELCLALSRAASVYLAMDCYADAWDLVGQMRTVGEHVGDGEFAMYACHWLAVIATAWSEHLADLDPVQAMRHAGEAREAALATIEAAERFDDRPMAHYGRVHAALAEATLDQPLDALEHLDHVVPGSAEQEALVALARARALRMLGDYDLAEGCLEALAGLDDEERAGWQRIAQRERILLAEASGEHERLALELLAAFRAERGRRIEESARWAASIAAQVELHLTQIRMTQREREIATLKDLSSRDPLTGLLNRRGAEEAIARFAADGHPQVGIGLVDVDHFKAINDTWSHTVGDAVLARLAELLRGCVREQDVVARFGGDEFAVVTTSDIGCLRVSERFHSRVLATDWTDLGEGLEVTVTVGVSTGAPGDGLGRLVELADVPLYEAKEQGRNRVVSTYLPLT